MPNLLNSLRRDQRGVAMIEMALVLPVLLVVLLGIVDFARAFNYWNDTNQLAADGARFAAVDRNPGEGLATPVTLQEFIRRQAETEELRSSSDRQATYSGDESVPYPVKVCIDINDGDPTDPDGEVGDPITVRVFSTYALIPLIGDAVGGPAFELKGEATMRLERPFGAPRLNGLPPMTAGCVPSA